MIEVKNLTKQYGSNLALNHISFSLEEGTSLVWRGTSLSPDDLEAGHRVAVTYTGPVAESEPGQIYQVLRLEVLGDEL